MGPLDLHPFKVIYTFVCVCVGTHMTLVLIRKVGGLKFQKTFTGSKNPPDSRMDGLKSHPRCERIGSGLSLESLDGINVYYIIYNIHIW